jgi:hypothetical protein
MSWSSSSSSAAALSQSASVIGASSIVTYSGGDSAREQIQKSADQSMFGKEFHGPTLDFIFHVDSEETEKRLSDTGKISGLRLPGATILSVQVREFQPVVGFKRKRTAGGQAYGFTSLSGLVIPDGMTISDFENLLYFIGSSKSDYQALADTGRGRPHGRKTGCGSSKFGKVSATQVITKDIFPGDVLIWRMPTYDEAVAIIRGGDPQKCLTVRYEPMRFADVKFLLMNVCQLFLNPVSRIGISLPNAARRTGPGENSPHIRSARSLKTHALTVGAKTIGVLATREIIEIMTPYKRRRRDAEKIFTRALLKAISNTDSATYVAANGTFKNAHFDGNVAVLVVPPEVKGDAKLRPLLEAIEAYNEYAAAFLAPKTDPTRGINVVPDGAQASYSYYSENAHLANEYARGVRTYEKSAGAGTEAKVAEQINFEAKRDRMYDELWIAYILGLTNEGQGEETKITRDVIMATHLSLCKDPTDPFKHLLGSNLKDQLSRLLSGKQMKTINEYNAHLDSHNTEMYQTMMELRESITNKTVGTALSHAKAGLSQPQLLDIMLGVI